MTVIFKNAFSLVELMVVLSIISIITGLAIPKFKFSKLNAHRVEAKLNTNHFSQVAEVYESENGILDPAECDSTFTTPTEGTVCRISSGGVNFINPFGLGLDKPDATKYWYFYHINTAGGVTGNSFWQVGAISRQGFMGCDTNIIDRFDIRAGGNRCHTQILDPNSCTTATSICFAP